MTQISELPSVWPLFLLLITYEPVIWRFNNFYGQHGARLGYKDTVPGERITSRTLLIRFLSPLLFFAPDRHLERIRFINPIDLSYGKSWSMFISSWEKSWNDYILYVRKAVRVYSRVSRGCFIQATVLLAVNVSFLAIPDVTPTGDTVTPGFVASLCSIITSVGCIVVGLLLVNEDHTNPKDSYAVSILTMCLIIFIDIFIVILLYQESGIWQVWVRTFSYPLRLTVCSSHVEVMFHLLVYG